MTSTCGFDQLRRKFRNQINVQPICALIDREVLAFNEAAIAEVHRKKRQYWRIARTDWTSRQDDRSAPVAAPSQRTAM